MTRFNPRKTLLAATALAGLAAGAAHAQTAAPAPTPAQAAVDDTAVDEIIVTGIRRSLQASTTAKRDAVAFGDSIFAEDIGKLPATNLAETLNRIPGVTLNRDINGEGVQVSIRGLGPSFSKVLLNNTQIAVASDGGTTGGSANREVDLDFFPSELFTRLDVAKSPMADTLEGGIAGTVNLHSARPFDREGQHLTVIAQGQYTDSNKDISPRGALVASKTWDKFGVLFGVSGVKTKTRVDGYETVGYTDGNIACAGCNTGADTGNGFFYASVVPNNTGHGLTAGAPLDLAATSGLSLQDLSRALIPRLGRNSYTEGTRSRVSALLSLEYRPTDDLQFAIDGIWAKSKRDYQRLNMNWYVRNSGPGTAPTSTGGMVPIDLKVDANHVVTSGTFANSSFFLENDIFDQTTKFYNVNPTVRWQPRENIVVDAQVNYGHSTFFREQPQFDFQTPRESGLEVYYQASDSGQPSITTNRDLGDPNLGWRWYRVNVQNIARDTTTKGAHVDARFGDSEINIKVGAAYDQASRSIRAYDNSTAFQTAVCGATCDGATGLVLNSQVGQYLRRVNIDDFGHLAKGGVGYTSFIMTDLDALKKATNYAFYRDSAPRTRSAVTGGSVGDIEEKTWGTYVEANAKGSLLDRDVRMNVGLRYFHTDQTVTSPIQVASGLTDQTLSAKYDDVLPSANFTYDAAENIKLRLAISRSMTRADAGQLLPGTTFSDISAQVASAGNPDLKPYTSNNIDIGGEYYTGGIGYVGVAFFRKDIDGFTVTTQTTVPFTSLGINFTDLNTSQQQALNLRGGPSVATVTLNRPINLNKLLIQGVELTWVQPLDFLVKGLGFSANATKLEQSSSTGLFAPGVAPYRVNLQGFYEGHGASLSVNYVWNDESVAANGPQNNINVPLKAEARGQLDVSAGYVLPFADKAWRVTLDALNITNEPLRTTFGYDNAPYSVYYPGRQVLLGLRASF
ncbi:TonB-dependent receptor [Caulobacter sp. UNC279MFTsu5.1]|uniref:TonB-dependent receptor n=1 Tax=Caulobacter sp. UNC279MFTsu5.1 TaxID=1502775 RepID=UPI00037EEEEB|nr:TonB-dependent receptor [Caulobacter sp. UNC279MFTsu5.1]SFJ28435.1 TonB-dependent receptor [Caulobacter sp. UNC279MFTsu5.1]